MELQLALEGLHEFAKGALIACGRRSSSVAVTLQILPFCRHRPPSRRVYVGGSRYGQLGVLRSWQWQFASACSELGVTYAGPGGEDKGSDSRDLLGL
jgi:hypothetical protein